MSTSRGLNVVTLCTGNVARSVMLGYMLSTLTESAGVHWNIRTAGTHVTEGSAMSSRTRDALMKIEGLGDHRYGAHRSHQLVASDCEWADVILAAESDNVFFARTNFPQFADKAVQLGAFMRFAPLQTARGPMFGAAHRAGKSHEGEAVVSETELYGEP